MADSLDANRLRRPPIDAQVRNYARRHGSELAPVFGMTVAEVHRACEHAANRLTRPRMKKTRLVTYW